MEDGGGERGGTLPGMGELLPTQAVTALVSLRSLNFSSKRANSSLDVNSASSTTCVTPCTSSICSQKVSKHS